MNRHRESLLLSIALHGLAVCSLYAVSSTFARPDPPVVIDFTVSPDNGTGKEAPGKVVNAPQRKVVGRMKPVPEQKRVAARSEPERAQPIVPDKAPAPPVERFGPAAITSERKEGPSAPVTAATAAASDNTVGTAVSASGAHAGMMTASGGSGNSAEQLRNGYMREHFAYIKEIIQRNINYPSRARKMGWMGRVVVSFVINENGRASDEKILESSGFEVLDNNVITTIKTVSPFPRPPVKAELHVPIIYRLE
jgi:protein TonB